MHKSRKRTKPHQEYAHVLSDASETDMMTCVHCVEHGLSVTVVQWPGGELATVKVLFKKVLYSLQQYVKV